MRNSEISSETKSRLIPKWLVYGVLGIAYIGFLDAMYLTAEHYSGAGLNCVIFTGCDQVANSEYSLLFGLPVALLGALYYLGILFISLLYLDVGDRKFHGIWQLFGMKMLPIYTFVGLAMSLRFVYLQAFVIKAFCTYCLFSAVTSTLLFILGIIFFKNRKQYL